MKFPVLIAFYVLVSIAAPIQSQTYQYYEHRTKIEQERARSSYSQRKHMPLSSPMSDRNRNASSKKYTPPVHPCEHSSCYPATGNLLIGRENNLHASSTCGLNRNERFCIVSHLEERNCFLCETTEETKNDPLKNHRVGQMIYATQPGTRTLSWWQSVNGEENVTIQLDMEAEFHFTHLIIVFATFRPAAMLIERSYDFGKTWHVYRYFAHNCADSFPGVPQDFRNITDVVCDSRYSSVEPSKNGEVIFRVLPPSVKVPNPYAPNVQNLLKMTNLRINFTRLHKLGDTLLDNRVEIKDKYYYAISSMIVRGSCSCYGHASRCLPLDATDYGSTNPDMVHGRCECTHNTKGLNCEVCEDFYNDLPWKPALKNKPNACKKCNCNEHAGTCHFDEVVFERSGKISGGVCDNCQHNTQGQHCEECKPFYFRDPLVDISSPYVCRPCDCNNDGSIDDGICDSISETEPGQCHCKANVQGRQCDMCREGYWNLNPNNPDGCQECSCNILGTINNSGCDMYTGKCDCKANVVGQNCNVCRPNTYGLSEQPDGCTPCNCDVGGSLDDSCDVHTGQCHCRGNMQGRRCNTPIQNYFVPEIVITVQAEGSGTECLGISNHNCTRYDQNKDYVSVPLGSEITFSVDNIPRTMTYDVEIKYKNQGNGYNGDNFITLIRPMDNGIVEVIHADNCQPNDPAYEQRVPLQLPENRENVVGLSDVCLEKGKTYRVRLHFERSRRPHEDPSIIHILVDSLKIIPKVGPDTLKEIPTEYFDRGCDVESNDPYCEGFNVHITTIIHNGSVPCDCDPTGSTSKQCDTLGGSCICKPNVIGRRCDACAAGTFGFGPEGCKSCDCNSIGSRDNDCDVKTGQCKCLPNTFGRECDQCQRGFWNFPTCQICQCNGHTDVCDSKTGQCLNCGDSTTNWNCDQCVEGFYGDPQLGSEIGCRPCRCPDTVASNHSHAITCQLARENNNMQCLCKEGYSGQRCDECADNYFGSPELPGGVCSLCECSANIDTQDYGNCDPKSGKCLKCLHHTTGDHCESCSNGYFGNALNKDCRPCNCEVLGTNSTKEFCDNVSGQCPCLPNVIGVNCNECIENHWKIASGEGCEICACDSLGSLKNQCNPYDGQCECRTGFGGRQCNQCEKDYYGDPNVECHSCKCNLYGSASSQCDRNTGKCICKPGIGGEKCDVCARGFLGQAPYCSACGECFDNWDLILQSLETETNDIIKQAKEIKTIGATGAYTTDFNVLDIKLKKIREILDNTTISSKDLFELDSRTKSLQERLQLSHDNLAKTEELVSTLSSNLTLSKVTLKSLRDRSEEINQEADKLKATGIELQESNIEGALNLTKSAYEKVIGLSKMKEAVQKLGSNTERQCKRIETVQNKLVTEKETIDKNKELIKDHEYNLNDLFSSIPDMNAKVCGAKQQEDATACDPVCGGAGCGKCGGELSCAKGALTNTEEAQKMAKNAEETINKKKDESFTLIRSLTQANKDASEALANANTANVTTVEYFLNTTYLVKQGEKIAYDLNDFKQNETDNPKESKELVQQILSFDLEVKQNEINDLSDKIQDIVRSLSNVDHILSKTEGDIYRVNELKRQANETKIKAQNILDVAQEVVSSLSDAFISQQKARKAIDEAQNSISLASKDLESTDAQTTEAEQPANKTAANVKELLVDVNNLQKISTKNVIDAKTIQNESSNVEQEANKVLRSAKELKEEADDVNSQISKRDSNSKGIYDRATRLLDRAANLTVTTQTSLDNLNHLKTTYKDNDSLLLALRSQMDSLTDQMKNYVDHIKMKSEEYRTCN